MKPSANWFSRLFQRLRRAYFRRRYKTDSYESVLGSGMKNFLNESYEVNNWAWHLRLLGFDRETEVFRVSYDDNGPWAGTVEVSSPARDTFDYKVTHKETRTWPPPEWKNT